MSQPASNAPIPSYRRMIMYASFMGISFFIGSLGLLYWLYPEGDHILIGGIASVVLFVLARAVLLKLHFRRYTYLWYRQTYPAHARSEGRVSCRHCDGRGIFVRNLMQRTYTRAHVCNQCGTTLYFSPER